MSTLGNRFLRIGVGAALAVCLLCLSTPAMAQAPGAAPPPPPPPGDAPPPAAQPNPDAPPPATAPPPAVAPAPSGAPSPGTAGAPPAGPKEPWWKDVRQAKNSVFIEGMGAGLWYSLNYERVLGFGLAARVGFGYWSMSLSSGDTNIKTSILAIPIALNYIGLSRGSHGLEVGAGTTLFYVSAEGSSGGTTAWAAGMTGWGNVNVGYRYQPRRLGFQFRVGFQMIIGRGLALNATDYNTIGARPWGYISFGFTI